MSLLAGLSLKQVGGEYDIDMCDRTTWRSHSLDANATDGIICFLSASSSNTVFDGTAGALVKMTLVANGSYQGGEVRDSLRSGISCVPLVVSGVCPERASKIPYVK